IYRDGLISKLKLLIKKMIYNDKKLVDNSKKKFQKIFTINNLKVLTVSEHSKYSILSCFPSLDSDSIKVVPAPHKYMEKRKKIEKEKRFLLISGNRWIKNNYRAIKALDSLMDDCRINNYKVTVVGWKNKKVYNGLKNKDNFSFVDYVSENKLNDLFISSEYFIYPTLNEGYGYPPLKAFESDTVVISSCHTSIIEVCKDAALYFNPYSIIEMKNRILNLVYDEKLKEKLILNGRDVIENLPNSSQLTMDIINEIFE
ncbi:glycosyl transferase family 1, partial [Photobacterium sp. GB-27]|uniref:glycosyltransferase n=1 Tax=Photobacterium sp. GB-27 TaxID=2022109 RepID=UPI000D17E75C